MRHLRESRGETRKEFADFIGNCTASAVVQWEGGARAIPHWVEEKLLRAVSVTLPLDELSQLVELATARGLPFEDLLSQALRDYIAEHSRQNIVPLPVSDDLARVTEDPAEYRANSIAGASGAPGTTPGTDSPGTVADILRRHTAPKTPPQP
jgi:transcriptional regulator with XRE-family HTH domain